MEYRVIWHDREDERTGDPFMVEAASPIEAHRFAVEELGRIAHMFQPSDIECLVDQKGTHLHPQLYLAAEEQAMRRANWTIRPLLRWEMRSSSHSERRY